MFIAYCWMRPKLSTVVSLAVDHTALLSMLQSIGLDHVSFRWFFSYLTLGVSGRCIRTKVSNHLPVLAFYYCIWSSPRLSRGSSSFSNLLQVPSVAFALTALFADDTLLFQPTCQGFKSSPCCPLQADLDALSSWAIDLNVSFNALKSVDFCLGRHPSPDLLQVDGVVIPRRTETRHLGVVLSVDQRWNSHIDHILSVTAQWPCLPLSKARLPASTAFSSYSSFLHRVRPSKAGIL